MATRLAVQHYDRYTAAYSLVMGEAFHYGLFVGDEASEPVKNLERAALRLNVAMFDAAGPLAAGARVLDVGCGIGGPARWMARTAGLRVRGLTNSAVGAAEATRLSAGVGGVEFVVGDAQDNGEPDDSFDLVWVMESSHLMPDKPAMIREGRRVLKPGGRMVLCDQMYLRTLDAGEMFAHRDALNSLDRTFGRARMETLSFYAEQFEAAGLGVVSTQDLTELTRPTLQAWADNARTHRSGVIELIGEPAADDMVRACQVLQAFWGERIGYAMITGLKPV